ncbi:glycoside hydrolase family 65 protein [Microbacterium sp. NPDC058389]|uniref:glycoside hydrolase family 65 protein n=1 Tax=Microbacterium sp. NPDC058389 TaxID=3346475 RepID=UPI0036628CB3
MTMTSVPTPTRDAPSLSIADATRQATPEGELWRVTERGVARQAPGVAETIFALGNGYLGWRGNHAEGDTAVGEHGTFINGFHETFPIRHAEQAYGFAEVGQTIINAPDGKVLRVSVDGDPLSLDLSDVRQYERELDMRDGVMRRRLVWVTPNGKGVQIDLERLVSFDDKHLAVTTIGVTLINDDAEVTIDSRIVNRQDAEALPSETQNPAGGFDPRKSERLGERVLRPQEQWQEGLRSALSYRTARSGMTIAVVADHIIDTDNDHWLTNEVSTDAAATTIHVYARAGVKVRVTKLVSYHTASAVPTRELIDRCCGTLDIALRKGVPALFAAQRLWLDGFWARSDVQIGGQERLQQAVRWCLFQLAQASARADGLGIPAKGVTGSGYSGHYFWDTEIYVLPFLTYTTPLWARNALRMRYLMLPAARKRAAQLNELGALFPWRTINGEESSAYYPAGTAQYHINADICFALAQYVRASGDVDFLYREGVDIAVETARLWSTLGFWREGTDGSSFHIHGVTGPDEYTTVVNDNLFTNVMARFNLRFAAQTVRAMLEELPAQYQRAADRLSLDLDEVVAWERAADAIHIPYDAKVGIHPQDDVFLEREVWLLDETPPEQRPLLLHFHPLVIYRYQVLKQADVVLALFLQGDQFTDAEKLADFEYYDPLTTGDSTLSAVVQAILASEVGYQDLALEYFERSVFVDLADLHHNASDGVHVASAGGVWTALVAGFGGMRDHRGELSFDPRLPVGWEHLSFPLSYRGRQLRVTITADELTLENHGGALDITVRDVTYTVPTDGPLTIPLEHQGPVRPGRPAVHRATHVGNAPDGHPGIASATPIVTPAVVGQSTYVPVGDESVVENR